MRTRTMRGPLVLVVLVVLVGLAVADRGDELPVSAAVPFTQEIITTAPGPDARGGVWYCSEGTSLAGEFADHSVIVANPTAVAVTASVSVFPVTPAGSIAPSAEPVEVLMNVPAWSESTMRLAEAVESPYTAALIEIDSGSAVVAQRVQGPTGLDVVPCATRSSGEWHFAAGSTRRDARLVFTLFNPFPNRAVVRFAFSTDEGVREPQSLRGVLVPARSLVVVEATDVVPRFSSVATTIESLAGQIVAGRLQLFDGSEGLEGLTAGPGLPGTRTEWLFPTGPADEAITEHIMLYNPSDQEALAGITLRPDGLGSEGLLEVTVPPKQRVAVVFDEIGDYPVPLAPFTYGAAALRPTDGGFWVGVLVFNGVPIAAERVAAAPASSPLAGVATKTGFPAGSTRHVIAGNRADGAEVALVVVNPSPDSIALVTVSAIADRRTRPVDRLDPREVAPGGRVVVPVSRLIEGEAFALSLESNLPVVASRSLLALTGTGLSSSAAVPFDPVPIDPANY